MKQTLCSASILIVLFCCCIVLVNSADIPSVLTKCHITDNKCIVLQANRSLEFFSNGLPEFNIPSVEPMRLGDIVVPGSGGLGNVDFKLIDVQLHNYSSNRFTSFKGFTRDTSKPMKITYSSYSPKMTLKSKYKINGKILILPITGEGDLEWKFTGVHAKGRIMLESTEREGKTYLHVKDYKLVTKLDNVHINMTNLFNGDKDLSENMLQVLNENWETLSADITPKMNEVIAKINSDTLNKFFHNVPYDTLFLPDEE